MHRTRSSSERIALSAAIALVTMGVAACGGEPHPGGGDAGALCENDTQCGDDVFCNGVERCAPAAANADARGCVAGDPPCAANDCNEASNQCSACATPDVDGDGRDSIACGGDDCDDSDANRFPGNPETCADASGALDPDAMLRDEDCDPTTLGTDADGDGFYRSGCSNPQADGQPLFGVDCDDMNSLRRPGFAEICDGLDNDCVGGLDFPGEDDDGDGFADCTDLMGQGIFDCDDANAMVNPGVTEDVCDFVDADCSGDTEDLDGDGFIATDALCIGEALKLDCDDTEDAENISPDGIEICNGVDDDCSGTADDNGAVTASCPAALYEASSTCEGAAGCGAMCASGFGDCDADPSNGCEANLRLSRSDCGRCGQRCPFGCTEGVCITATQVASSALHHCAVLSDGGVACWGDDGEDQLGDGDDSREDESHPVRVRGLPGPADKVTVGISHSCALMEDGSVFCWGEDTAGQLGNGAGDVGSSSAAVVPGLSAMALSAGFGHTCAVLASGAVSCWGFNPWGQVGIDPTTDIVASPTPVAGLADDAIDVSVGADHSCALLANRDVQCWGRDASGTLGNGAASNTDSFVPVTVVGLLDDVQALASADAHACALLADGTVMCWGADALGQSGDGDDGTPIDTSPVLVSGLTGVTHIGASGSHTCAQNASGISCWGGDVEGELGDGVDNGEPSYVPLVAMGLDSGVTLLGDSAACAGVGAELRCWGPVLTTRVTPTRVAPGRSVVAVHAGDAHSCAVFDDGTVACWGLTENLGRPGLTSLYETAPGPAPWAADVVELSAGGSSCALRAAGTVECWGRNDDGQVGNGESGSVVEQAAMAALAGPAASVSAGAAYACALLRDGRIQCWGRDDLGQVGDGSDGGADELSPTQVQGLGGPVARLALGRVHACALLANGAIQCWGSNADGQLGTGAGGASSEAEAAAAVTGLTSIPIDVVAGAAHTCALLDTGTVQCWGSDEDGQLGDGADDGADTPTPQAVPGLSGVVALSAGAWHTCAVLDSGEARCWGQDDSGQLGNGADAGTDQPSPVAVAGLTDALDVSAGGLHTCAQLTNGDVYCWGADLFGAVGDGSADEGSGPGEAGNDDSPVRVLGL